MNQTQFASNGNILTVKRSFNAPIGLVWRAWTEAELLDQWWAPKPWKSETSHMEFKIGGFRLYAMVGPEGERHNCRIDYLKISQEKSFAGKDSFCDDQWKINHELPTSEFTHNFINTGQDETKIESELIYESESDLKTIIEMGMKEGLEMAYNNLDELMKNFITV